jgi:hypothetical protein
MPTPTKSSFGTESLSEWGGWEHADGTPYTDEEIAALHEEKPTAPPQVVERQQQAKDVETRHTLDKMMDELSRKPVDKR